MPRAGHGDAGGQGAGGADGVLHVGASSHAPSAAMWAAWRAAVLTLLRLHVPPQNPEVQKRMVEMQNDPEMKDFFDAVKVRRTRCCRRGSAQARRSESGSSLGSCADSRSPCAPFCAAQTGGPAALAKFWNDEKLLLKISQRLGGAAGQGPPPQAAPQKPPEVTNLLEACRWGDVEAAEDFIAIGKSVDEADKEGRTPLYAPRCTAPMRRCASRPLRGVAGTLRLRSAEESRASRS